VIQDNQIPTHPSGVIRARPYQTGKIAQKLNWYVSFVERYWMLPSDLRPISPPSASHVASKLSAENKNSSLYQRI